MTETRSGSLATVLMRTDEAVALGHPLLLRFAGSAGTRVLFIKGFSLGHHGLRGRHDSVDVDVLVDPAGFDRLVAELRAAGWHEREKSPHEDEYTVHSTTLIRDGWPCDLDLHRVYPGCFEEPAVVFEALWARRVSIDVAGHPVPITDRSSSALILALHSLRGSVRVARHGRELDDLVRRLRDADAAELDDLAAVAREIGALGTAAPFLERLGVDAAAGADWSDPRYVAWRRRVGSGARLADFYLDLPSRTPWRSLPGVLARVLWPTERDFRRSHPGTPPGRGAAITGRWRRFGRGLRDLPVVLVARARVARERRRRRAGGSTR